METSLSCRPQISSTGAQCGDLPPRTIVGNLVILLQINLNCCCCYFHSHLEIIQQNDRLQKSLAVIVCQPNILKRLLSIIKELFCLSLSPPVESTILKYLDLFQYPEELRRCQWLHCGSCMFHLHSAGVQTVQVI